MANFTKYDYQQTLAIMRHDFRTPDSFKNKAVDLTRSHLNENIGPTANYEEARGRLQNMLNIIPHSNRKDLVCGVGYVITLPEQATTAKEKEEFFKEAYKQLCDQFTEERILCAIIHNDENKPHLQAILMPIVRTEKNEVGFKFCAKEFLNRKILTKWHKDLQQRIEKNKELKFFKVLYKEN